VIALRDLTTETLLLYGREYPKEFLSTVKGLIETNDPYVVERILAVSYAITDFHLKEGTLRESFIEFAQAIFDRFLSATADLSTTHLLIRDHASCIVKIAVHCQSDAITAISEQDVNPPFPKMPRKRWKKMPVADDSLTRSESPFRMDFANYTIGSLVKGRANYDNKHTEYQAVRDEMLWRVEDLGWNSTTFGSVDREIEADNSYSRSNRPTIERYGKKYSWIAFYEMAGERRDQGNLQSFGDYRFSVDIDPFFPENIISNVSFDFDYLGSKETPTEAWVAHEELPSLDNLSCYSESSNPSRWVLIEGYVSEQSRALNRHFNLFVRSLFLSTTEKSTFESFLSSGNQIDWPEQISSHYVYSGEFYSLASDTFETNSSINVVIGTENRVINVPYFVINGKKIEGGERIREIPKYEEINCKVCSINYSWTLSARQHPNVSFEFLAPWVVEDLELTFDPTRLAYLDFHGEKAVLTVKQKDDVSGSTRELTFIRNDLLSKLGKTINMELVRKVSGERRFAKGGDFHTVSDGQEPYKDFEFYLY
jgi:hypothetical protein